MLSANRPGFLTRSTLAALILAVTTLALPTLTSAQAAEEHPTFTRDVVPILQASCQNCHRPKGMAPMPLVTYEQVLPFAPLIKYKTSNRTMPPWHIDPAVGIQEFQNDRSLSQVEIDTIGRWADAGAPQGNPADLPPAAVFADDNHLAVQVTWSVYQRIIAAYGHPDRRRGKTMMIAIIDSLRRGVPEALEELAQLGRTLHRRRHDVLAFFDHHTSNGPTEAINGRLEALRRNALGFRNLAHYRWRSLLHSGALHALVNAL